MLVRLDPPERAMARRWLAVAAAAVVTGAYAAQVVAPAAETSLAPIAAIAPSYDPKTASASASPLEVRSEGRFFDAVWTIGLRAVSSRDRAAGPRVGDPEVKKGGAGGQRHQRTV